MSSSQTSSVGELLAIFRGSLLAVIPWLEKARIKWNGEEAYDDWDNIAEALYENIVCASLTGEVASDYDVPKYDFQYHSYALYDFVGVRTKDGREMRSAFVSFQTRLSPLDSVLIAELNEAEEVVGRTKLSIDDCEFYFSKRDGRLRQIVDVVTWIE